MAIEAASAGSCGGASSPWGRDERLADFAQGWPGDTARPTAWQLMVLSDLCGPDGACPDATDDEALGLLGQWGRAESWVAGRKLAVLREVASRYPAAEDARDDDLAREVSLRLTISIPAARKLIDLSVALGTRLPGIGAALDEGRLGDGGASKARMVWEELSVLDDPHQLARAEEIVLTGLADCPTWAALQRLAQRAVCTVDPEGARKRREKEEREHARVKFWREAAGTSALVGTGLPTDEALAAHAHVEARARQYRDAGVRRRIEILRVAAYLDLLNGAPADQRVARFAAEDAARVAAQEATDATDRQAAQGTADSSTDSPRPSADGPRDDGPAEDTCAGCDEQDCACNAWPAEAPCELCGYAPCRCGADPADGDSGRGGDGIGGGAPGGDGPGDPATGSGSLSAAEPGFAGRVNLTLAEMDIPLLTAFGLGRRPGDARALGPLDPALARRLAEAAARNAGSTFCLTIVNGQGHAIGHGCLKPIRKRRKRTTGSPGGHPGDPPPAGDGFTITGHDRPGPPGGYGSFVVTLPGRAGAYVVDLHPVPTGECGHGLESARHAPGDLLRHLVEVRDGKCGFPTCTRHARESDFEHSVPFEKGGATCGCNCWSCSRSCHQVKQSPRWSVEEIKPGWHQWTTPSGRRYTQQPWRYPV